MKTLKKIGMTLVLLTVALTVHCQTFYEVTFQLPDNNDNYVGLLVYNDAEHCKMRIVNDEAVKENSCYASNYTCVVKEKEGRDDVGVMYLAPENEGMPILMWVWEKSDQSDVNENPYLGFDIDDTDSWIETSSFTEITLADMSEDYIKQFFSTDEPEYLTMLSGIQTVQGQSFGDNSSTAPADGAPTLHLMVVANTNVSDIGPACDIDQRRIRSEFSGIAKALGMKLDETLISGQNYSMGHVGQALNNLNPDNNDVVVFVYTGHGFRFKDQQDYYPCLDLSASAYDDAEKNFMALSDIFQTISQKSARLNIVLSDCCNSTVNMNQPVVRSNSLFSRSNTNFNLEKLRTLFLKTKGDIIATAASPGEFSWCGENGGFFLLSFFESLRSQISALNQDVPSWDALINNAISAAARKTESNASTKRQNGLKDVLVKSLE